MVVHDNHYHQYWIELAIPDYISKTNMLPEVAAYCDTHNYYQGNHSAIKYYRYQY